MARRGPAGTAAGAFTKAFAPGYGRQVILVPPGARTALRSDFNIVESRTRSRPDHLTVDEKESRVELTSDLVGNSA